MDAVGDAASSAVQRPRFDMLSIQGKERQGSGRMRERVAISPDSNMSPWRSSISPETEEGPMHAYLSQEPFAKEDMAYFASPGVDLCWQ